MSTVIISLHGFNSGPGQKAQYITQQFPDCQVIAPQLPYDPLQAVEVIRDIIDQHDRDDIHIVGTSLGAFYAMYISRLYVLRDNIIYYLINPSFEPHTTLRRYDGKVINNYKTQQQFETTHEFFEGLRILYYYTSKMYNARCIHSSNYFIGTEDEVVDFTNFTNFIKSFEVPYRMYHSKQDHRYSDLSDVVEKIRQNMFP